MNGSLRHVATLTSLFLLPSCSSSAPAPQRTPAALVEARTDAITPPSVAVVTSTPWRALERASRIEERQGTPLALEPGARCKSYRQLPALSYTASTLVQDACLEIPSRTTIEARDGATVVIVATHGLRLGNDVVLSAKGAGGRRGARAPFASTRREVGSDAEIRAVCVERGNQCACPSASAPMIQGQPGEPGASGGSIHLFAGELVLTSKLARVTSDVSGGPGGPPGDSGVQECARGEIRCSSQPCSTGVGFGASGPPGRIVVGISGSASAQVTAWMSAHTTPASALTVVDPGGSLLKRAVELDDEAVQKGWQRRAGRASELVGGSY